ncbi:MAG: glycine betaine/L-proline ABC transporter substrate-binding protein ProX [Deferribacterales bacterium]
MKLKIFVMTVAIAAAMTFTAFADNMKPGKGVTLQPARATWDTGFFTEELARKGLEELGYKVKKVKDLAVPLFYQSVALGDVDYWVNGWFPMHDAQLPKNFDKKAEKLGYVVKAGGLQGYLVSKKYAEEYNIKSLEDFKRPEVMKAFDTNGDGKADLIACPPGWGCEKVITHHFDVYGLDKYINPIKASYSASMAEGLAKFKNGEPVFFYTWSPNWTIFKMQPGKDVVWINVPETNPTDAQKSAVERMEVSGVTGAVTDPVKLGFVVADIMTVANKKFLEKNPAAAKFLKDFKIPLLDINAQNTRMNEGEKSAKDIAKHADEWIANNKATWDGWLAEARAAAK